MCFYTCVIRQIWFCVAIRQLTAKMETFYNHKKKNNRYNHYQGNRFTYLFYYYCELLVDSSIKQPKLCFY